MVLLYMNFQFPNPLYLLISVNFQDNPVKQAGGCYSPHFTDVPSKSLPNITSPLNEETD